MPTVEIDTLKPFRFHGLDLQHRKGDKQATGECPWCRDESHFSVALETGLWQCMKCHRGTSKGGGNPVQFLRTLWEESLKQTTSKDYHALRSLRQLRTIDSLKAWGVARSILSGEWLVPGFGTGGKLDQLYVWKERKEGKRILMATPGQSVCLFGVNQYVEDKPEVWLCEGPWDGIAVSELLSQTKRGSSGVKLTKRASLSLAHRVNVLAVPGSNTFKESWLTLFRGKTVTLFYDSDHPKERNGQTIAPAGYEGVKKAGTMIRKVAESVYYIRWGEEGYDPSLPSGFDLRDGINTL